MARGLEGSPERIPLYAPAKGRGRRVIEPRQLAVVRNENELLAAIRARRDELQVTHETIDAVSGLQPGYTSKLLCDPPIKRLGPLSYWLLLGALGCTVGLVEDQEAMERVKARLAGRKLPVPSGARTSAVIIKVSRRFMRKIGALGGRKRAEKRMALAMQKRELSERNRENGRKGALKRWHTPQLG